VIRKTLIAAVAFSLVACVSPTRDTSERPSSLADRTSGLDGLTLAGGPEACGITGITAERGGFGSSFLILDQAPAEVVSVSETGIVVKLIPSDVIEEFAWPTENVASLFHEGEPVHLTRKSRWESATESTIDFQMIIGLQARVVFASSRRVADHGSANDPLTVATPLGPMTLGPVECEEAFADGCSVDSGQRFALALDDGALVAAGSPLSREDVIVDWARGSRVGSVAACAGGGASPVEEALEVAYFGPAPARERAELADARDLMPENLPTY